MVISGLLIQTDSKKDKEIIKQLKKIAGLDIVDFFPENRIGLVLEAPTTDESHEISSNITKLPGVVHLSLIYHNFEDEIESLHHNNKFQILEQKENE